jgi:hypothetical protein
MLLVHDAIGPGAYQLHDFPDAKAAEEFVSFWFPPGLVHGLIAFWSTHWRPDGAAPGQPREAEAVVLVRDEDRAGIVYPFSLPEMGLAQAWAAREATLGLELSNVLLYWASPVAVARDRWGRVRLTPREAPERPKAVAQAPAEAPAAGVDAAAGQADAPTTPDFSRLVDEVEKLAHDSRFEQREGPFRGFDSPEGKF